MHKRFDHKDLEQKWQSTWQKSGLYDTTSARAGDKEYVLVEWPYPSGNLHIGHWYAFAVPDIYVRFRRMQGMQVLYPIGFDAFGLPAENAAIKHGLNPREWTEKNIAHMKGQLQSMGNAFSWDMTTSSIDPEYYKWTQWMFTQFFEHGIAYKGAGVVNWCPGCHTAIANEQVLADGTCERSGDVIEKKQMPQWMLKITDFADALIDDLDTLNWPEHIKEAQRQWIGRSRGAELHFTLSAGGTVTVFTTRPDTLFGATYVVVAPEHPLLAVNQINIENWPEVATYVQSAKQKAEQDRLDATKEKTGVRLQGITAINPASGEEIPVFVADYVLGGYGTGAIMAVPAHDVRDFEFATKFELPITTVISGGDTVPYIGTGNLMNSGSLNGVSSEDAKSLMVEKYGGKLTNTYRLRDWSIGRQRYWGTPIPIVYDPQGVAHVVPKEHLPWTLPEDVDFRPTGEAPLAKSEALKARTEKIFGPGWTPEVETMDTFVDSSWYFLRYVDNTNDLEFSGLERQLAAMPVDLYFGGAEHTTMHLLYSRFWQKALFSLGLVSHNEPYTKRINRGLIMGPDGNKMSKSKGNVVDPDEQVDRVGADTVKMYLAFMGPYAEGASYPWDMGGIAGIRRFLERVYGLTDHLIETEPSEVTVALHKTIKKVTEDMMAFKFNTAISALMIFINLVEKTGLSHGSYVMFLKLLAPFAPHLTEELWKMAGMVTSIHSESFPVYNASNIIDETITIGVQINGKLRGDITIAPDANQEIAWSAVQSQADLISRLNGQAIQKVIYVPGRIMNIIIC
jgi:leucyl-tRNA synthetase